MSIQNVAHMHPVQWSEGMLLSPQHLQQQDKYWDQQLCSVMSILQPHFFGISQLEIDQDELVNGKLVITSVSGIMPDGLIFNYPIEGLAVNNAGEIEGGDEEESKPALYRDLDKDFEKLKDGEKFLPIYLQVPKRGAAAAKPQGSQQRFIPKLPEQVVDENTGYGAIEVNRLAPNLSLSPVLPNSTFTYLQLLVITKDADDMYRVANYYPPMLTISALKSIENLCLQEKIKKLRVLIRKRTQLLTRVLKAEKGQANSDLKKKYSMYVLNLVKALPLLDIYNKTPDIHPFSLYTALANFLGQISTISSHGIMPPVLPGYNHRDSHNAFVKILRIIEKTVLRVGLAYVSVLFRQAKPNLFYLNLNQKWAGKRLFIELSPNRGQTVESLQDWITNARIGEKGVLKELDQMRATGIKRTAREEVTPIDLYQSEGCLLFELESQDDDVCNRIEYGKNIFILGGGSGKAPKSITLYVARSDGNGTGNQRG